jgi:hypothetical protein
MELSIGHPPAAGDREKLPDGTICQHQAQCNNLLFWLSFPESRLNFEKRMRSADEGVRAILETGKIGEFLSERFRVPRSMEAEWRRIRLNLRYYPGAAELRASSLHDRNNFPHDEIQGGALLLPIFLGSVSLLQVDPRADVFGSFEQDQPVGFGEMAVHGT